MGFRDKLQSFKENFGPSPVRVMLAGEGSDPLVTPGGPATVKMKVSGQDDGSVQRIELSLLAPEQSGREWPLGEVPVAAGLQSLDVTIPPGIQPSCAVYSEYFFKSKVIRTKGLEDEGLVPVDVISTPETIYWPEGPRSGSEGSDDLRIEIALTSELANTGDAVRGTVRLFALRDTGKLDVVAKVGAHLISGREPKGKDLKGSELRLEKGLRLATGEQREFPLTLDIPSGLQPTLAIGQLTRIVWKVEVSAGKTTAWQIVGVMDPKAAAGMGARTSSSLGDLLITTR